MKNKMSFKKTCSIYASDLHFATVIYPFIKKEIENKKTIKTIFETNQETNIEKILENVYIKKETREKIKEIDWKESNINKIKDIFSVLENNIKLEKNTDIIVLGSNIFINKVNKAIDLWIRNNIEHIKISNIEINIINCFSFEENKEIDQILDTHEYILKTSGIKEIDIDNQLQSKLSVS